MERIQRTDSVQSCGADEAHMYNSSPARRSATRLSRAAALNVCSQFSLVGNVSACSFALATALPLCACTICFRSASNSL